MGMARAGRDTDTLSDPHGGAPVLVALRAELENLGLNGYEAKMVVALLRLGSATASVLATAAGVPRTSAYGVLEALEAKGLAEPRPGRTGVWASPGRAKVLERLQDAERRRWQEAESTVARAGALVARLGTESPAADLPFMHVLDEPAQVKSAYERLLAGAESEVVVFSKPPYATGADQVNTLILETLQRGVKIRVLYQATQEDDPAAAHFWTVMAAYHEAGVLARVVDALPVKLAVADRRVALLSMADPVAPDVRFPANLYVEDPGFASFSADAFELRWRTARSRRNHAGVPL